LAVDLFSIGSSSLRTSKRSLETTSHNIANANTEGFSRQKVHHETNLPVESGSNVLGNGVNVKQVKRVHDNLIEKNLIRSTANHTYNEERTFQLERVEEVFNEINTEGLNKVMNKFFNSFRELSNQPENEVVRSIVRDNANVVAADFKRIQDQIGHAREAIDTKIVKTVEDINLYGENITKLNKEIIRLENAGGHANDLRDQRDQLVRNISEYFTTHTYEDKKGQYVVNVQGVGTLVTGGITNKLKTLKSSGPDGANGIGKIEVTIEGRPGKPISHKFLKGSMQAMFDTRDIEIEGLNSKMDDIAHGLVHATNAIHRRGYANKEIPTDENGNVLFKSGEQYTGINFFKEPIDVTNAASKIELSDEVKTDLNNISTGLEANSPGDNRVAIAISKLQHEKVFGDKDTTFEEHYHEAIGEIGTRSAKAQLDLEQTSGVLAQAKSIKERLSGVSLDEETANMVKFQHAYDASARMIKTADEMFDSVLNMMR
jgi:flagellar hook-associated protein 1 FlgK